MAIRRRINTSPILVEILPIVHLWLLRILVPLGGHREFINQHGFNNDALADVLGLGEWVDTALRNFQPKSVRVELRKLHKAGEQKLRSSVPPACLTRNISRLSTLVELSDTDCRIRGYK